MNRIDRPAEPLWVGLPGVDLDPESESLLADHRPGGIVLFGRNCESPEQLGALVRAIRRALPGAILAIDAEGGRVDRLRGIVGPAPSAARLAAEPPCHAFEAGRAIGRSLRLFDLDVDFAPVVDLDRGKSGNALDDRTLGSHPGAVVERARAFLAGLHAGGAGGCLKHFPGLGGAGEDTHLEGSVVAAGADQIEEDLAPFIALAATAGAVMIAHAAYPALDADLRPATLSPPVHALLRHRLGREVLAISDDLEMKALDVWGDLPARTAACFAAGCDVLPVCKTLEALPEIAARLADPALAPRHAEARLRTLRYRRRLEILRSTQEHAAPWAGLEPEERLAAVRRELAELA